MTRASAVSKPELVFSRKFTFSSIVVVRCPRLNRERTARNNGGIDQDGDEAAVHLPRGLQVMGLEEERDTAGPILGQPDFQAHVSEEGRIIIVGQVGPLIAHQFCLRLLRVLLRISDIITPQF